jgi:hypothetical protein
VDLADEIADCYRVAYASTFSPITIFLFSPLSRRAIKSIQERENETDPIGPPVRRYRSSTEAREEEEQNRQQWNLASTTQQK